MNSKLLSIALFFAAAGNVFARDVKFSIITFGKSASVNIVSTKQTVQLAPSSLYNGIQTVSINGLPDEELEYSYTIDGKPEPGVNIRKLPANVTTTYNELVGRPETISKLKGMGYPDGQEWTRSFGETELFDDSYIPTVIFDISNQPNYFTSPYDFGSGGKIKVPLKGITIILKETIFSDSNVVTSLKSRYNDKFQFKVKFSDDHKIYKRKSLKFRAAGSEDASYLGESLYVDLAQTIGNPVHDSIFVRVYTSDGTPIGLYNMIDVTASKSFLKAEFNGSVKGKENKEVGAIFECHNADFVSGMSCSNKKVDKDDDDSDKKEDKKYTKQDEENDKKKIASLVEAFDKVDANDQQSIKEFSDKWLDLDTLFKALALEYLCGHWDSYWEYSGQSSTRRKRQEEEEEEKEEENNNEGNDEEEHVNDEHIEEEKENNANNNNNNNNNNKPSGGSIVNKPTNYLLYQDPRTSTANTFKFFFVDQDFDQTFGVGKKVCGPECSYKTLIAEHQVRVAQVFLKEGTLTRKMFEEHLKSIVQHAYNPKALGRRIDEYQRRFASEIQWDFDEATFRDRSDHEHVNRNGTHKNKVYTYSDHEKALENLRKYIETRAKTVTKDLDFEWDSIPMEPKEKVVKEEPIKYSLRSDARMNKAISTSAILAVALVFILQLLM